MINKGINKELILLYHAILIGASPLIPVPFLDESIAAYFWRHLVEEIAKLHAIKLSKEDVRQLANQQGAGCANGCSTLIILPLREIYREIFFWLEWRRGIDLATKAYYYGYLLNITFEKVAFQSQDIPKYRLAIQRALAGVNTRLLREVIAHTFYSSRGLVRAVTAWLFRFSRYYLKLALRFIPQKASYLWARIRRKKRLEPSQAKDRERKLDSFFEEAQPKLNDLTAELVESLSKGIGSIPGEHFDTLTRGLVLELQRNSLIEVA
jgi:hypothetical protein